MPLILKWRYISSFFDSNTAGKNLLATVPIWLMLTQYLSYPKSSGLGSINNFNMMKYYLPADHVLYENHSLLACLRHTTFVGIPRLMLHFLPHPYSHVDNSPFSLFGLIDGVLREVVFSTVKDVTAWCIGKFLAFPFKAIYARCGISRSNSCPTNHFW